MSDAFNTYEWRDQIMAKGKSDVILRDRLQFTLDASGNLPVVYGRMDLSDYVNAVEKKGLAVKELHVQPRIQNGSAGLYPGILTNTGSWTQATDVAPTASQADAASALKVFATTRAYQHAYDVGIGSPDVFHLEEWITSQHVYFAPDQPQTYEVNFEHRQYTPLDLHPDGYALVSDILIGVAADDLTGYDSSTLELDVMVIAEPITIGAKQLTEMLTQAQDI